MVPATIQSSAHLRSYTTIDKSAWGAGPWQDEPDKVQWVDEQTGLPCLAVRHPRYGHWCGYAGVAPGHPLYEVSCWDVPLELHVEVNYSEHCLNGPEERSICHVPEPGEPDHVWWFGFDCGHWLDLQPGMAALMTGYLDHVALCESDTLPTPTYKTLAYVRARVAELAAELASA